MSQLHQRSRAKVERARRRAKREERERTAGSAKRATVALSLAGQTIAGYRVHNDEQRQHGQPPVAIGAYMRSGAFLEATVENWESEFLQLGSPQSKPVAAAHADTGE